MKKLFQPNIGKTGRVIRGLIGLILLGIAVGVARVHWLACAGLAMPAGRFAVLRFSGGRSAKQDAEALGRLWAWMQAEGLKELSPPVYGYFDPPWTPGFLRRNEVMLRTEGEKPK